MDIKEAFDLVYICILILQLFSFHVPNSVSDFISFLFYRCYLNFFSPYVSIVERLTYRSLPQRSCLIPLLFNVYSPSICNYFISYNIHFLFYVNYIIIFTFNKYLLFSMNTLNNSLRKFSFSSSSSFFCYSSKKKVILYLYSHIS